VRDCKIGEVSSGSKFGGGNLKVQSSVIFFGFLFTNLVSFSIYSIIAVTEEAKREPIQVNCKRFNDKTLGAAKRGVSCPIKRQIYVLLLAKVS